MAQGLSIRHKRQLHIFAWVFWTLVLGTLIAAGWFAYRYFESGELPSFVTAKALQADPNVDETVVTKKQVNEHKVPKNQPRYISIPMLKVDKTRVFAAGTTANNQLEAPKNIADTVWYKKSALPGSGYGAILIDGHNGGVTRDGVFAKLGTLGVNAQIMIERGDGKVFTYKVVENRSMPLEEVNKTGMKMMMQSADETKEGLNLITCDGKWVPKYQQFDRRIMLRAVRIE